MWVWFVERERDRGFGEGGSNICYCTAHAYKVTMENGVFDSWGT